jgi:hypothetical protein
MMNSPSPLPDTIIAINVNDQPFGAAWSYTRPAFAPPSSHGGPPLKRAFLMPHFSFWSWPTTPFVGSFRRAAAAIESLESRLRFRDKDSRLVWRGTTGYYGAHRPGLRDKLIKIAGGKPWADVQALEWKDGALKEIPKTKSGINRTDTVVTADMPGNALMVEDFCRYKYVLHTEGITYSGRFQLHQLCASVLLAPPIAWMQHTTHLVRPVFSRDLPGKKSKKPWVLEDGVDKAWPKRYLAEEANMIFVSPDWSDLEDTIRWLEDNPEVAEEIAHRQRDLFVGGGYFSPAAEVCYWRAMIKGWSKVVQIDDTDGWSKVEGIAWEEFIVDA